MGEKSDIVLAAIDVVMNARMTLYSIMMMCSDIQSDEGCAVAKIASLAHDEVSQVRRMLYEALGQEVPEG